jgi:uncharacterized protein YbjT (DUF2867 family)
MVTHRAGLAIQTYPCAHVHKGNILNKDDCKKAVKGIDSVFHTAAVIDYWSRFDFQRPLSYAVNVTGLEVHTPLASSLLAISTIKISR